MDGDADLCVVFDPAPLCRVPCRRMHAALKRNPTADRAKWQGRSDRLPWRRANWTNEPVPLEQCLWPRSEAWCGEMWLSHTTLTKVSQTSCGTGAHSALWHALRRTARGVAPAHDPPGGGLRTILAAPKRRRQRDSLEEPATQTKQRTQNNVRPLRGDGDTGAGLPPPLPVPGDAARPDAQRKGGAGCRDRWERLL